MLKYLIIQLCDTAPSFCHYNSSKTEKRLISLEDLKAGILFGMKENLNMQFIYPDYELPEEYKEIIDSVSRIDIVSSTNNDKELLSNSEIIILETWDCLTEKLDKKKNYVLRTSKRDLVKNYSRLISAFPVVDRINIVLTDIPEFKEDDYEDYKEVLKKLSKSIGVQYEAGIYTQLNILTDRIFLKDMNNCNAGEEVITLAPDGKFYICPAYYASGAQSEGNLIDGLNIRNPQLFKLSHSPICRNCDAYQCKRCVWLNEQLTLDVNTPSKEQCVVSHLERNESKNLLEKIREKQPLFMSGMDIKRIDYLDPFDNVNQWK